MFSKYRVILLGFVFVATSFMMTGVSRAAETGVWVDNFNISVNGHIYQSKDFDDNWDFDRVDDPDPCKDRIYDIVWHPRDAGDKIDDPGDDDTTAKLRVRTNTINGCIDGELLDVDLTSPNNAKTSFIWNGEIIQSTNANPMTFSYDSDFDTYVRSEGSCKDTISIDARSGTGEWVIWSPTHSTDGVESHSDKTNHIQDDADGFASISYADYDRNENGCLVSQVIAINVGNTGDYRDPGGGTVTDVNLAEDIVIAPSCENRGSVISLEWIMCPILRGIDRSLDTIEGALDGLLSVTSADYDPSSAGYKTAWSNLKNVATFAVVITALFMVISTALDFGFFSNYTIKKYLPRFAVSVIVMQLSWFLFTLSIDVITALGDGIEGIMFGAFNGGAPSNINLSQIFGSDAGGALFAAGGGAVAGFLLGSLTVFGVAAMALGVFVSMLTAFVVLVIRKILILLLLVISPLAIAAWVLPGSDKVWGFWRTTFFSLLFMYPVIVAMLAAGKIAAWAAVGVGAGGGIGPGAQNITAFFIGLISYVAPYALILVVIQRFSGLAGSVMGAVNDKSKGFIDTRKNSLLERDKALKDNKKKYGDMQARRRIANGEDGFRDRWRVGTTGSTAGFAGKRAAGGYFESQQRSQGHADAAEMHKHKPGEDHAFSAAEIEARAARIQVTGEVDVDGRLTHLHDDARPDIAHDRAQVKVTETQASNTLFDRSAAEAQVQSQADKARVEQEALRLTRETASLTHPQRMAHLLEEAKSGNEHTVRAAVAQMGSGKAAAELMELQEHMLEHGTPESRQSWNTAMGENYGDLADLSGKALNVELPLTGPTATGAAGRARLDSERLKAFDGMSDAAAAGMSEDSWKEYWALAQGTGDLSKIKARASSVRSNQKLTQDMAAPVMAAVDQIVVSPPVGTAGPGYKPTYKNTTPVATGMPATDTTDPTQRRRRT